MFENNLKTISKTPTELRIANHIVLFNSRDLEFMRSGRNPDGSLGDYFAPNVSLESQFTRANKVAVDFEHGEDEEVQDSILGYVDWSTAKKTEQGWFVQRVLDRRNKYVKLLETLVDQGLLGTSSEAYTPKVKKMPDGGIVQWPIMRDTITVFPCEPRMLGDNVLKAVKTLNQAFPGAKSIKSLLDKINSEGMDDDTGSRMVASKGQKPTDETMFIKRGNRMVTKAIVAIKRLVPGLREDQYESIVSAMGASDYVITPEGGPVLTDGGFEVKSLTLATVVNNLKSLGYTPVLPGQQNETVTRPVYAGQDQEQPKNDEAQKSINAVHYLHYSDESESQKTIMRDVIGKDYQQKLYDQRIAFGRYLRGGERNLTPEQTKSLKSMYLPVEDMMFMVKDNGYDTKSIKDVQVEAVAELGGFATPPEVQSEIRRRLPGLTSIRRGGARVITLASSNSTEINFWKGNSNEYIGTMRGQWGTETQAPGEQNFALEQLLINANIYTYKVPMSRSLVEDASNLIGLVTEDILSTLAIDEDKAFLIGDGVGKPMGLLPGGANVFGFTEVPSEDATGLTPNGIKALKRAIPTQYRGKMSWVANSDTYGLIERLQYTVDGHYVFEDLSETDKLLARMAYENPHMADVAAAAYPILAGDMSGYTIVERLGMTIERFMDSGTGPNKVEFHVRTRRGGHVEKPYLFALQVVEDVESV